MPPKVKHSSHYFSEDYSRGKKRYKNKPRIKFINYNEVFTAQGKRLRAKKYYYQSRYRARRNKAVHGPGF